MLAQEYIEIADDLREVTWDIEDAIYTNTNFSADRMADLKKLYQRCEVFMYEFEKYQKMKI